MTEPSRREPDKWHRIGVVLSLVGLLLSLAALYTIGNGLPPNWHVTTRHSDRPEQVEEAMRMLEREIVELESQVSFRVRELQYASGRAKRKAEESRIGVGESGRIEADRAEELKALAPRWDRAAGVADEILARRAAAGAPALPEGIVPLDLPGAVTVTPLPASEPPPAASAPR